MMSDKHRSKKPLGMVCSFYLSSFEFLKSAKQANKQTHTSVGIIISEKETIMSSGNKAFDLVVFFLRTSSADAMVAKVFGLLYLNFSQSNIEYPIC